MTKCPGKAEMSLFGKYVDLSKASGSKLAQFETIFCYSVPIHSGFMKIVRNSTPITFISP